MQPSLICTSCRRAALVAPQLLRSSATTRAITTQRTRLPSIALRTLPQATRRTYSSAAASAPSTPETPSMTAAESAIAQILTDKLSPTDILVQDVSGGCGSMYAIEIASAAFKGQTILKQQRMVNAALGDMVKEWHGVQIRTRVPDS